MSQSGYGYDAQDPKDSARTQSPRPDTSGDTTNEDSNPEPACPSRVNGRSADQREWCVKSFTDGIREFYQPCGWSECFPTGPPDVDDIEKIVRSSRKPTVYHRPRETTDGSHCTDLEHNHNASNQPQEEIQTVREPIATITELDNGDSVIWNGVATPATVVGTTTDPNGTVLLAGTNSEYSLEGRPECARAFYIQHFGCRNKIARVVSADNRVEEA